MAAFDPKTGSRVLLIAKNRKTQDSSLSDCSVMDVVL